MIEIVKLISVSMNAILLICLASSEDLLSLIEAQALLLINSSFSIFEMLIFYLTRDYSKRLGRSVKLVPLLCSICFVAYYIAISKSYEYFGVFSLYAFIRLYLAFLEINLEMHIKHRSHIIRYLANITSGGSAIIALLAGFNPIYVVFIYFYMNTILVTFIVIYYHKFVSYETFNNKIDNDKYTSPSFILKILFSTFSGYVLSGYLLLSVKDVDPLGFSQWAIALSVVNLGITLTSVRMLSYRTMGYSDVSGKYLYLSSLIGFIVWVILYQLEPIMADIVYLQLLMSRFPESSEYWILLLLFAMGSNNAFHALNLRRKCVEPTLVSNVVVFIILILSLLNYVNLTSIYDYLIITLFVNFVCFVEVIIVNQREKKGAGM